MTNTKGRWYCVEYRTDRNRKLLFRWSEVIRHEDPLEAMMIALERAGEEDRAIKEDSPELDYTCTHVIRITYLHRE